MSAELLFLTWVTAGVITLAFVAYVVWRSFFATPVMTYERVMDRSKLVLVYGPDNIFLYTLIQGYLFEWTDVSIHWDYEGKVSVSVHGAPSLFGSPTQANMLQLWDPFTKGHLGGQKKEGRYSLSVPCDWVSHTLPNDMPLL